MRPAAWFTPNVATPTGEPFREPFRHGRCRYHWLGYDDEVVVYDARTGKVCLRLAAVYIRTRFDRILEER